MFKAEITNTIKAYTVISHFESPVLASVDDMGM